jgi:hypothetical protein
MIGTARLHRCLGLLLRVWARHGDPLSLHRPIPRTPPRMTPRPRREGASDRDAGVVSLRPHLVTGDHRPRQRASWVKSA